jgi:hypothetical protein
MEVKDGSRTYNLVALGWYVDISNDYVRCDINFDIFICWETMGLLALVVRPW